MVKEIDFKKIIVKNIYWNLISGPIRFGLNIYLTSILLPEDFGVLVIPMIIASFSEIIVDSGFKASLIQKVSLKKSHSSTVFFLNLVVSTFLFALFSVVANPLSVVFGLEELTVFIPLVSFNLIIKSTSMVNEARLQIKGAYDKQISAELVSYVVGYGVAIFLAKSGFGPWSLIAFFGVNSIIYSAILFLMEKFTPSLKLVSKKLVFVHWRFGSNLLWTGLLTSISGKADQLIISKISGVTSIGLYSKGMEYSNTLGIIGSKFFARPWFSIMSKYSNKKEYFESKFVLVFSGLSFLGISLVIGNSYLGSAVVSLFLGEAWLGLIPLMVFLVVITALYYLVVFNKYSFLALGLPNLNFKIELTIVVFRVSALLFVLWQFLDYSNLVFVLLGLDIFMKFFQLVIQGLRMKKLLSNTAFLYIVLNLILLLIISLTTITFGTSSFKQIIFLLVLVFSVTINITAYLKSRE